MRKYQIGILTSFHDDYAVDLLTSINQAIKQKQIDASIPFVFSNKSEGVSAAIDRRIKKVNSMENIGEIIQLSTSDFRKNYRVGEAINEASNYKPKDKDNQYQEWRLAYDSKVLTLLPKVDSVLSLGYMHIMSPPIFEAIDIVNIHPAIPDIGPVGMWPEVMTRQAERAVSYLLNLDPASFADEIPAVMNISWLKAGGMLHIATEKMDRGPVISWYELPLIGEQINQLWEAVTTNLRSTSLDKLRKKPIWEKLIKKIRTMQFKGEKPLILSTYRHLTKGNWEIKDRTLYIDGKEYKRGYCLNREILQHLV